MVQPYIYRRYNAMKYGDGKYGKDEWGDMIQDPWMTKIMKLWVKLRDYFRKGG